MAQHDYQISNGSGIAVRNDVNNALAAVVTQNAGSTAPSPTYPYMWWADTTSGHLKQRNAANTAWIDHGSMAESFLRTGAVAPGGAAGLLRADGDASSLTGVPAGVQDSLDDIAAIAQVMHLQHQENSGVQGGSSVSGAVRALPIHTLVSNTIVGASFSASTGRFTLPAGLYEVNATHSFYRSVTSAIYLGSVTGDAVSLKGESAFSNSDGGYASAFSFISGVLQLSGPTSLEPRYRSGGSYSGSGLGLATGFGDKEIYGNVFIRKLLW
ncbi:hypothetical protein [Thalassospira sp. MCCC 1A01428]|uniref:hypothetical protein n=1 Tax=Thalassospira sp. MCCC 1A01428 TaxID=1470575 RepID=UPI000A1F2E1A|nr:hypothetical protein [Thalassospira sp. MCCC 1A01428]